ncbi:MAG TPA: DUF4390 domain-containing protein [Deltaproteobacteria bacterium]|nr:DUF4390 domain-containing protein [Deltaproteobacteria bacterium]
MNSTIRKFFFLLFLAAAVFAAGTAPVNAQQANITDVIVTNSEENVIVYLSLGNCFTPEMEEAVFAGITTTFIFTIELYRHRSIWFDKKISSVTIRHSMKYDNIKRTLFVSYSHRGVRGEPEQFTDFTKAQRAMTDLNGVPVAELADLDRGRRYYVRIRAELDKVPLPMDIKNTMLFSSLWYFETDWVRQDFVY